MKKRNKRNSREGERKRNARQRKQDRERDKGIENKLRKLIVGIRKRKKEEVKGINN